jgi:hypothetical protein
MVNPAVQQEYISDVSEYRNAVIFRAKLSNKSLGLLHPEVGGTAILSKRRETLT